MKQRAHKGHTVQAAIYLTPMTDTDKTACGCGFPSFFTVHRVLPGKVALIFRKK